MFDKNVEGQAQNGGNFVAPSNEYIRLKRDQMLIDNQLSATGTAAVCAVVLTCFLYFQSIPEYLAIWSISFFVFVVGMRFYLQSVKKRLPLSPIRRNISITLSVISGVIWGSIVFTLVPDPDPAIQNLVCFAMAGITAGVCISMSSQVRNVIAFNTPALTLPAVYLVNQGGAVNYGMAFLIAIYFVMTLSIVRRSNRQVTTALENEFAAERKSEALEHQKSLLDKEVAARNRSETQLMAILAQARSFNGTLERVFKAFLTHDRSSDAFIRMATEEVSRALSIERVSVWFFSENRDRIVCQDLFQASDATHTHGAEIKAEEFPKYFEAIDSSMAIVASNAGTDPRTCDFGPTYLDPQDIKSLLDAPLTGAEEVRGIICCESVAFPRDWSAEEVSFVTSIAQFISIHLLSDDSRNLAEALREAMIAAQKASATKSVFLANMSHEIRTPMNGVMGMLDLLRDSSLSVDQLDKLDTARNSASVLLNILDDVLDVSKLEAGQVALENRPCAPRTLVQETISLFEPKSSSKNISLTCEIADDLPPVVNGDPLRIKQVLNNLVGNAIKFTNKGQVTIGVTASEIGDGEVTLRFSVSDTGVGIPEAAKSNLFQRFVQADTSTTREFGGTGLGLAICRQLVTLMGGTIDFESRAGTGSTFWFTIPTKECQPATPDNHHMPQADDGPLIDEQRHILVAEDNPINQKVVQAFLEPTGHIVEMVNNGAEALAAVQAKRFDLILMDVQMPLMDGVTATKAIRNLAGPQKDVPIIALTANAMSGDREKYLHHGMTDYISKPIDPIELGEKIRAVSSNRPAAVSSKTPSDTKSSLAIDRQTPTKDDENALSDSLDDIDAAKANI